MFKPAVAAAVASLLALGTAATCAAEPAPRTIAVASTFPGSMPIIGAEGQRLASKLEKASGGSLRLEFHEPGELVPAADTVNAVADGRVPAAWAGAGWFADRDSAFNFFSTVPFGPGMGEYLAWMYQGGGLELSREMFHAQGVHNIPCALIPPEASGWFRKEIRTVRDLSGLRMRFFGLGAKVMQKLGVVTVQLPPGQILGEMEAGTLDAAEFSLPTMDQPLALDRVAKYYYFPGWHQQATLFDLYINKSLWDGLPEQQQVLIELACGDTMRAMIADGEGTQWRAQKEMQAKGVQLKHWSPEILVALENAWEQVIAEEGAKNPSFAKVYASYATFRQSYVGWSYLGFLQ